MSVAHIRSRGWGKRSKLDRLQQERASLMEEGRNLDNKIADLKKRMT